MRRERWSIGRSGSAPVDARHNGAARVLMCLANVADDEGATRIRRTGSWPRGASAA